MAELKAKGDRSKMEGSDVTSEASNAAVWKPTRHELLIMISLALLSLMISLDATIVITSLSVRLLVSDDRPLLIDISRPSLQIYTVLQHKDSG
jgi:hypothetical protein